MLIDLSLNSIRKILIAFVLLVSLTSSSNKERSKGNPAFRIIHNNDGTDALANMWFNKKANLSRADINRYVDIVADTKVVTTYMMCTGSDFVYYRSKYERPFGDDVNGTLGCEGNPELRDA